MPSNENRPLTLDERRKQIAELEAKIARDQAEIDAMKRLARDLGPAWDANPTATVGELLRQRER